VSRSVESERPVASSDSVVAGRYRLERPLGQGGAAEVFAAYDELTGRRVALKRLLGEKGSAAHDTLAAHFRHEFLVLSQVAHANVIEAYDFGLEQGVPYYTMELVEGAARAARSPGSIEAGV
jgi:serine/threonine-protein kinase